MLLSKAVSAILPVPGPWLRQECARRVRAPYTLSPFPDLRAPAGHSARGREESLRNFKRPGVAYDFGKLSEPDQLPPRQRAEPEHPTIERCQQQDIEITVGDVGTLVGKHSLPLRQIPIDALGRKQDG